MQVLKHARHRQHQMYFGAPIPHLHQRSGNCSSAEQQRFGLHPLEIAADRDRLGDHGAVVEH